MAKKIINESSKAHFIQRMQQLADIKKPVSESINNSDLVDFKRAANGSAYAIVRENHNFYLKVSNSQNEKLNVADFAYIGGLENKLNYQYKSLSEADKNRNLLLKSINEGFKNVKADNVRTKMVVLSETSAKKGSSVNEGFGEEEGEESPEAEGGDEKADIEAAASKIGDLDAAASAEKSEPAADAAPAGDMGGGDIEGAADAAGGLDSLEAGADAGGTPEGGADIGGDAAGAPEGGGVEDAAGGLDAIGGGDEEGAEGGEVSDGDKAEFKKLVGKVQQQASATEMTPEEAIANLKQILAGFKGAIDSLDDVQKKEIANKILKAEPDAEGEEGALGGEEGIEGGEDDMKMAAEGLSGFKQHVSEMGYDPSNTSGISMSEMVGVMNSYFNKTDDSGEQPDYQGLAEFMNHDIVAELQECGYGDHAQQAQAYMGDTLAEYSSEEAVGASIGEDGEEEEGIEAGAEEEIGGEEGIEGGAEEEMGDEAGAEEEMGAEESPVDAEVGLGGAEDAEGMEDVTSEIPTEEPVAAGIAVAGGSPSVASPSIAPMGDVMGAGLAGGSSKKSVTVDLKNDTINLSVNESSEGKLRKIVKRRIEEKLGLKKPVLSESNSPLLKLIDKYIEDEIKKRK